MHIERSDISGLSYNEQTINTVLYATRYGQKVVINLSARDVFGRNILHNAVISGDLHLVRFLLDQTHKKLCNEKDSIGNTPLHWAYIKLNTPHTLLEKYKREIIADYLLSAGSSLAVRNIFNDPPMSYLKKYPNSTYSKKLSIKPKRQLRKQSSLHKLVGFMTGLCNEQRVFL